jgi:hypothetical protein
MECEIRAFATLKAIWVRNLRAIYVQLKKKKKNFKYLCKQ